MASDTRNTDELTSRIAGVRSEAFDLVHVLRHVDHDGPEELGVAGDVMQRIANQLGDVQRLVQRAGDA